MHEGRIFISYSRHDGEFALQIARDLRASGVEVWIDQLDLVGGPDWRKQVQAVLAESRRMIVVLSPEAVASRFVRSEWTYVLDSGDSDPDMFPLVYRECEVPFGLHAFQRIFFEDADQYETAFERLLIALRQDEAQREGSLRALAARARQATDPLVSAFPARGFNREVGPGSLVAGSPEDAATDASVPVNDAARASGGGSTPPGPSSTEAIANSGPVAAASAGEGVVTAATVAAQGASFGLPAAVAATIVACALGGGAWYGIDQGWFDSQPPVARATGSTPQREPATQLPQPPAAGARMRITTRPGDASVVLDGVGRYDRDSTYDFGSYLVRVQAPGYESRTIEVDHRASGTSRHVELEPLPPAEGPMAIRPSPADATVTIDGRAFEADRDYAYGTTYLVEARAPGFLATSVRHVHARSSGALSLELRRAASAIDLRVVPADAEVRIDGAPFSPARAYAFDRTYELEVSAPGYTPQRREIRHGADTGVVAITLSPSSAPRPPTLLDVN